MFNEDTFIKYDVKVPRYTSYPVILDWINHLKVDEHCKCLRHDINSFKSFSLYIHIPFCSSLCTFCACNKVITKKNSYNKPYIQALFKEHSFYLSHVYSHMKSDVFLENIHLGGGTPTFLSCEEIEMIMEIIYRDLGKYINSKTEISIEIDPRITTKKHIDMLYALGYNRLSFGIQDVNLEVQKSINRIQDSNIVKELVCYARGKGFCCINFDIIYGLPMQNIDNIENTLHFIEEVYPERIAFYSYAHVPWKHPSQNNKSHRILVGYGKYLMYEKAYRFLSSIGYFSVGIDHFCLEKDPMYLYYKMKSVGRSFMGYTTKKNHNVIGYGVSAISSSDSSYVQNSKNMWDYELRTHNCGACYVLSHAINKREKDLRNHIMNIMIYGDTCWKDSYIDLLLDSKNYLIQELVDDDIITFRSNYIRISNNANPFRRLVASLFDDKRNISPHNTHEKSFSSLF